MKAHLIILLMACVVMSSSAKAALTDPMVNTNSTKIISLEKVPIVKVTLNGKTAYFILDSGSDVSLLHLHQAAVFQFSHKKRVSKSIIGASGGRQPLFEASQVELQIGQQSLQALYYATDLSTIVESISNSTGIIITGIMGMDLMRRYSFEIDYWNKKLTLGT